MNNVNLKKNEEDPDGTWRSKGTENCSLVILSEVSSAGVLEMQIAI